MSHYACDECKRIGSWRAMRGSKLAEWRCVCGGRPRAPMAIEERT